MDVLGFTVAPQVTLGLGNKIVKKISYPTLAQSKQDITTDIYLAEGIIDLPDQLSTGIGLAINFDLV